MTQLQIEPTFIIDTFTHEQYAINASIVFPRDRLYFMGQRLTQLAGTTFTGHLLHVSEHQQHQQQHHHVLPGVSLSIQD